MRQFAAQNPVETTGVTITMVAPGLCSTGLGRDAKVLTKIMLEALRLTLARTAEEGSWTYLHGLVVGEEGHGKFLSGCKIKDHLAPQWLINVEGQKLQKKIWREISDRLEQVQPGNTAPAL